VASVTATDWHQGHKTRLKLAFCLYKYFPHGGLQRDFLRIALECQRLGHDIRIYTLSWRGEIPSGFDVNVVPVSAMTNHTRYERFSAWVQQRLVRDPVDAVIGINKMPGLDVYYAADSCYEEKAQSQRSWLYRLLPRYRHFSEYEKAVFGRDSKTEILMISQVQKPFFDRYYQTQRERMQFLPPGISRDRIAPAGVMEIRADMRAELGVEDDEKMLLMLGSGFVKKGLSRALYAVRSLSRAQRKQIRFFVVGEDNPAPFNRLIRVLGIGKQVTILSGRDDVPRFLFAADLLILPAVDEAAGIVLLEAVVAGLPVLVTENCGYARFVEEAGMGELVRMPFRQGDLNTRLANMLTDDDREKWFDIGRAFAERADIYSLHQHAAEKIEKVALAQIEWAATVTGTIAFCLFKYFPYGGLQRDFMRIALETQKRGYRIRVYTLLWQGDIPAKFEVITVPVTSLTNHSRYRKFNDWVSDHLSHWPVDRVVGFNKMPGLDVYYAADSCYEDKAQTQRSRFYRSLPRYNLFSDFEKAVFGRSSITEILMISPVQVPLFEKYYETQQGRVHLLSPGIARDRIAPPDRLQIRRTFRAEMDIEGDEILLLMIGSGFITKGLDRTLIAVSSLPEELKRKTRLIVIGQDSPGHFVRMAKRLGIDECLTIFKGRDDIPRFLMGADLLIHPAYVENTGTVLLEAIVAGLPVIATDVCGYAHYIEEAGAGELIPSPFQQETFNGMLHSMITSSQRETWSDNGISFAQTADIYDMPVRAAEYICAVGEA
jgi:UDP-glucose:(heptosyl)LPS alpha-1,3-glucosyltransferase